MKKRLICPSMMCADFSVLKKEVTELEEAGADIFHIDIMDGTFVPNFGMGLQDLELIRKVSKIPVDVHLMIMEPLRYVKMFADMNTDIIYVHPEADLQPARTLDVIKSCGKKAGIAVNPGTSLESVRELLPLIDYLLIMTVNPGFAGQKYLEYVNGKIEKAVELSREFSFEIVADGAISPEKIKELGEKGVAGFVLGTSALFGKPGTYKEIIAQLRQL